MTELKIAYVPGVTPGKWLERWAQRYPASPVQAFQYDGGDPLALLADGRADMVFLRMVAGHALDASLLHLIPLYEELPVVCAPREHEVELYDDEVPFEDIAAGPFLDLADYPPEAGGVAMALEVVGSGAGLLVVPMSVGRLYRRRDVVQKVVSGVPSTRIGLAWRRPAGDDPENPLIEEFVGIVRGRAANSSRQPSVQERQQAQANTAQRRRQSGSGGTGKKQDGAAKKAGGAAKKGGGAAKKGGGAGGKHGGGKPSGNRPGSRGRGKH